MSNTGYKSVYWVGRESAFYTRVAWKKRIHGATLFYLSDYRSRKSALRAAIRHVQAIERELGKPHAPWPVIGRARQSTGLVGVRRVMRNKRPHYEATWIGVGDKQRRTSISIIKHGAQAAREKALAQRQRGLKERAESLKRKRKRR